MQAKCIPLGFYMPSPLPAPTPLTTSAAPAGPAVPTTQTVPTPRSLPELRQLIDACDAKLLQLLNQRAAYAHEVGEVKRLDGSPIFRPEREAQVIQNMQQTNPGPIKNSSLGPIWREIMSACRALEATDRIAYLGPEGTFSEEAALQFFGSSTVSVPCVSIDDVFHAASSGRAEYGVVPIENSTEGVISRSLDLLSNSGLHIVGEVSLLVRHHLLRASPGLDGIRAVYAHPQALAQCQQWLNANLPQAERHAATSNAEAARMVGAMPDCAAIAGHRAASAFGLHTVAEAIQDEAQNRTRFAVICLPQTLAVPAPSGRDRTSLVVSVHNRPGALYDLLSPLKKHGVSMTRFESRPARAELWEYYFHIDLQGHQHDADLASALAELKPLCTFYKVLGSFPLAD